MTKNNDNKDSLKLPTREEQFAAELERCELDRTTYRSLKRDLIGIEEENCGEIILQKCSGKGDWFEIADHSALMYYYYVCQPLKIKDIRFEDDYDSFFDQYKIGRIRVRGVGTVRKRIQQAKLYNSEYVVTGRMVFVLKKPFSKDRIATMKKREAKRRLNLNKTIEIKHADPLFYRNLIELMKWLHRCCSSKMDKLNSQTNGVRMVTLADGIMAKYLHSTDLSDDNNEGRKDDWIQIRKMIYQLKYEIQIVDMAGIWGPDICVRLFEQNNELLKLASGNLRKVMSEKTNSEVARG